MPSFDTWLGASGKIDTVMGTSFNDPETVGLRIAERSTSITVYRAGANIAAQTVRIDIDAVPSEQQGAGGNVQVSTEYVIILGYKNHSTATDTDLQRDDRFEYGGNTYRVIEVLLNFTDRLLARAKVTG